VALRIPSTVEVVSLKEDQKGKQMSQGPSTGAQKPHLPPAFEVS
jgi:hypothetical protein